MNKDAEQSARWKPINENQSVSSSITGLGSGTEGTQFKYGIPVNQPDTHVQQHGSDGEKWQKTSQLNPTAKLFPLSYPTPSPSQLISYPGTAGSWRKDPEGISAGYSDKILKYDGTPSVPDNRLPKYQDDRWSRYQGDRLQNFTDNRPQRYPDNSPKETVKPKGILRNKIENKSESSGETSVNKSTEVAHDDKRYSDDLTMRNQSSDFVRNSNENMYDKTKRPDFQEAYYNRLRDSRVNMYDSQGRKGFDQQRLSDVGLRYENQRMDKLRDLHTVVQHSEPENRYRFSGTVIEYGHSSATPKTTFVDQQNVTDLHNTGQISANQEKSAESTLQAQSSQYSRDIYRERENFISYFDRDPTRTLFPSDVDIIQRKRLITIEERDYYVKQAEFEGRSTLSSNLVPRDLLQRDERARYLTDERYKGIIGEQTERDRLQRMGEREDREVSVREKNALNTAASFTDSIEDRIKKCNEALENRHLVTGVHSSPAADRLLGKRRHDSVERELHVKESCPKYGSPYDRSTRKQSPDAYESMSRQQYRNDPKDRGRSGDRSLRKHTPESVEKEHPLEKICRSYASPDSRSSRSQSSDSYESISRQKNRDDPDNRGGSRDRSLGNRRQRSVEREHSLEKIHKRYVSPDNRSTRKQSPDKSMSRQKRVHDPDTRGRSRDRSLGKYRHGSVEKEHSPVERHHRYTSPDDRSTRKQSPDKSMSRRRHRDDPDTSRGRSLDRSLTKYRHGSVEREHSPEERRHRYESPDNRSTRKQSPDKSMSRRRHRDDHGDGGREKRRDRVDSSKLSDRHSPSDSDRRSSRDRERRIHTDTTEDRGEQDRHKERNSRRQRSRSPISTGLSKWELRQERNCIDRQREEDLKNSKKSESKPQMSSGDLSTFTHGSDIDGRNPEMGRTPKAGRERHSDNFEEVHGSDRGHAGKVAVKRKENIHIPLQFTQKSVEDIVEKSCTGCINLASIHTKYKIPSNCFQLQAPELESDALIRVSELVRNDDKLLRNAQMFLSLGMVPVINLANMFITNVFSLETAKAYVVDAVVLLGHAFHDMISCRQSLLTNSADNKTVKFEKVFSNGNDFGFPVDIYIANMVNLACSKWGEIESIQSKYISSSYCKNLLLPKLNVSKKRCVTEQMRKCEIRVQYINMCLATGIAPLVEFALSVESKFLDIGIVSTFITDSLTLLGHTMYKLSLHRCRLLRCDLPSEFNKMNKKVFTSELFDEAAPEDDESKLDILEQTESSNTEDAKTEVNQEKVYKIQEHRVQVMCQMTSLSMTELDQMCKTICKNGTAYERMMAKNWIVLRGTDQGLCDLIMLYLLMKIFMNTIPLIQRVHLVYLLSDILSHCRHLLTIQTEKGRALRNSLDKVIVPAISYFLTELEDHVEKQKLIKLVQRWETSKTFSDPTIKKLKEPEASWKEYQEKLIKHYGALLDGTSEISVNTTTDGNLAAVPSSSGTMWPQVSSVSDPVAEQASVQSSVLFQVPQPDYIPAAGFQAPPTDYGQAPPADYAQAPPADYGQAPPTDYGAVSGYEASLTPYSVPPPGFGVPSYNFAVPPPSYVDPYNTTPYSVAAPCPEFQSPATQPNYTSTYVPGPWVPPTSSGFEYNAGNVSSSEVQAPSSGFEYNAGTSNVSSSEVQAPSSGFEYNAGTSNTSSSEVQTPSSDIANKSLSSTESKSTSRFQHSSNIIRIKTVPQQQTQKAKKDEMFITFPDRDKVMCSVCNIFILPSQIQIHLTGKRHLTNVQNKKKDKPVLKKAKKKIEKKEASMFITFPHQKKVKCSVCGIFMFPSQTAMHLDGKRHIANLQDKDKANASGQDVGSDSNRGADVREMLPTDKKEPEMFLTVKYSQKVECSLCKVLMFPSQKKQHIEGIIHQSNVQKKEIPDAFSQDVGFKHGDLTNSEDEFQTDKKKETHLIDKQHQTVLPEKEPNKADKKESEIFITFPNQMKVKCSICNIVIHPSLTKAHLAGKQHQTTLQEKQQNKVTSEDIGSKNSVEASSEKELPTDKKESEIFITFPNQKKVKCSICKYFIHPSMTKAHLAGKRHQTTLQEKQQNKVTSEDIGLKNKNGSISKKESPIDKKESEIFIIFPDQKKVKCSICNIFMLPSLTKSHLFAKHRHKTSDLKNKGPSVSEKESLMDKKESEIFITFPDQKKVKCSICNIFMLPSLTKSHLFAKHRNKTSAVEEKKKQRSEKSVFVPKGKTRCTLCDIIVVTNQLDSHKKGKKHLSAVERLEEEMSKECKRIQQESKISSAVTDSASTVDVVTQAPIRDSVNVTDKNVSENSYDANALVNESVNSDPASTDEDHMKYFELPAGLILPLIQMEDTEYQPVDPNDVKLPPPLPVDERLIKACGEFYRDAPKDSMGWEKGALDDYLQSKQKIKAKKEEFKKNAIKMVQVLQMRKSRSLSPESDNPLCYQLKRRARSSSPSFLSTLSPSNSPSSKRPSRSRDRTRFFRSLAADRRFLSPSEPDYQIVSKSVSKKRKLPSYRTQDQKRTRSSSPPRRSSQIVRTRSPSPPRDPIKRLKLQSPPRKADVLPLKSRWDDKNVRITSAPLITPPLACVASPSLMPETPLGEENKGHQLLKKMGWSGKGLGAEEQGRVDPVEAATVRDQTDKFHGLGIDLKDDFSKYRKLRSKSWSVNLNIKNEEREIEYLQALHTLENKMGAEEEKQSVDGSGVCFAPTVVTPTSSKSLNEESTGFKVPLQPPVKIIPKAKLKAKSAKVETEKQTAESSTPDVSASPHLVVNTKTSLSARKLVVKWKSVGRSCPVLNCSTLFFSSRENFNQHWKEKHHEYLDMYGCPVCDFQSMEISDVQSHVKNVHSGISPEKQNSIRELETELKNPSYKAPACFIWEDDVGKRKEKAKPMPSMKAPPSAVTVNKELSKERPKDLTVELDTTLSVDPIKSTEHTVAGLAPPEPKTKSTVSSTVGLIHSEMKSTAESPVNELNIEPESAVAQDSSDSLTTCTVESNVIEITMESTTNIPVSVPLEKSLLSKATSQTALNKPNQTEIEVVDLKTYKESGTKSFTTSDASLSSDTTIEMESVTDLLTESMIESIEAELSELTNVSPVESTIAEIKTESLPKSESQLSTEFTKSNVSTVESTVVKIKTESLPESESQLSTELNTKSYVSAVAEIKTESLLESESQLSTGLIIKSNVSPVESTVAKIKTESLPESESQLPTGLIIKSNVSPPVESTLAEIKTEIKTESLPESESQLSTELNTKSNVYPAAGFSSDSNNKPNIDELDLDVESGNKSSKIEKVIIVPSPSGEIVCPVPFCGGKTYKTARGYNRHWNDFHRSKIPVFLCPSCKMTSKQRPEVVKHIKKSHADKSVIDRIQCQPLPNKKLQDPGKYFWIDPYAKLETSDSSQEETIFETGVTVDVAENNQTCVSEKPLESESNAKSVLDIEGETSVSESQSNEKKQGSTQIVSDKTSVPDQTDKSVDSSEKPRLVEPPAKTQPVSLKQSEKPDAKSQSKLLNTTSATCISENVILVEKAQTVSSNQSKLEERNIILEKNEKSKTDLQTSSNKPVQTSSNQPKQTGSKVSQSVLNKGNSEQNVKNDQIPISKTSVPVDSDTNVKSVEMRESKISKTRSQSTSTGQKHPENTSVDNKTFSCESSSENISYPRVKTAENKQSKMLKTEPQTAQTVTKKTDLKSVSHDISTSENTSVLKNSEKIKTEPQIVPNVPKQTEMKSTSNKISTPAEKSNVLEKHKQIKMEPITAANVPKQTDSKSLENTDNKIKTVTLNTSDSEVNKPAVSEKKVIKTVTPKESSSSTTLKNISSVPKVKSEMSGETAKHVKSEVKPVLDQHKENQTSDNECTDKMVSLSETGICDEMPFDFLFGLDEDEDEPREDESESHSLTSEEHSDKTVEETKHRLSKSVKDEPQKSYLNLKEVSRKLVLKAWRGNRQRCPAVRCSRYYLSEKVMYEHWYSVHVKKFQSFSCDICVFEAKDLQSMEQHWEKEHGVKKSKAMYSINYLPNPDFIHPGPHYHLCKTECLCSAIQPHGQVSKTCEVHTIERVHTTDRFTSRRKGSSSPSKILPSKHIEKAHSLRTQSSVSSASSSSYIFFDSSGIRCPIKKCRGRFYKDYLLHWKGYHSNVCVFWLCPNCKFMRLQLAGLKDHMRDQHSYSNQEIQNLLGKHQIKKVRLQNKKYIDPGSFVPQYKESFSRKDTPWQSAGRDNAASGSGKNRSSTAVGKHSRFVSNDRVQMTVAKTASSGSVEVVDSEYEILDLTNSDEDENTGTLGSEDELLFDGIDVIA